MKSDKYLFLQIIFLNIYIFFLLDLNFEMVFRCIDEEYRDLISIEDFKLFF
jgi:hypothetical protein